MVVMALGLLAARGQYDITRITGTPLTFASDYSLWQGTGTCHLVQICIRVTKGQVPLTLKPKLVTILCVLHEHPGLRTNAIGERTNIPTKSIERYMDLLKKAGVVYY